MSAEYTGMPKRIICIVITSRASYARIRTVLTAITAHPNLELFLVVTASALLERYGSVVEVMKGEGFTPDEVVYTVMEGGNLVTSAKSTGVAIVELATVFARKKPDVVVTIADRHETIATAIAASYLNIPVAHVQGGEITGSIDEKVRHAVTKLANMHFVANQVAAERVIRMGEDPSTVHVTGCPSIDIAKHVLAGMGEATQPRQANKSAELIGGIDTARDYVVVMQHPVTDEFAHATQQIEETLSAVVELTMPVIWFLPNVDAGTELMRRSIESASGRRQSSNVRFFTSLPPEDFLRVLIKSRCLVGNSSVGIREGSFLGIPTVNIGSRQRGRDRGPNVVDVSYDRREIGAAIRRQLSTRDRMQTSLYGDGSAGVRVAHLLADAPLAIEKRLTY